MTPGQQAWAQACLALELLATDPNGLRGMTIRARAGPVRDTFLAAIAKLPGPHRKLHPAMSRDALLGGLDVTQTLASGHLSTSKGLLTGPATLTLTMAERCPPDLAAILAAHLDDDPSLTLLLLDEGAELGETAPKSLTDRLAFHVTLDGIGRLEAKPPTLHLSQNTQATSPLSGTPGRKTPADVTDLTRLATRLGIDTLRLPTLAVRAARAHAVLNGRDSAEAADIQAAAELVLAPRATRLPEPEPPEPDMPEDQPEPPKQNQPDALPEDILIDAVRAVLPPEVLKKLNNSDVFRGKGSGAGQRRKGNRRGRPIPSRPGRLDGTARLDLVATLRAAAPWQTIRGKTKDGPVRIFPSDIHLKRYEDKSDRLIIFAVDASGSAALTRLGEAKGAVELLLARAYATRDHVALIAFRGETAEHLLPPTRSLVQAKRRLAGLPGGGGTPLALGLREAAEIATRARAHGLTPTLALLTDGRANIALDGRADRAQAAEDATGMARWLRALDIPAIVLDLGTRPQPALAELTAQMSGTYLPLPRATAERMSDALGKALDDGLGA